MRFSYDNEYHPPAPSVDIRFGKPGESLVVGPLRALVDTGANSCIIPRYHLDLIDLTATTQASLRAAWGESRETDVYVVDLSIGYLRFPSVEVAADDRGNEVLVGRNVLNKLLLTLDGPRGVLETPD